MSEKSDKLTVFISYSRQDIEFIDHLQEALVERGIIPTLDRSDIEKSEEWWARIEQLIIEADTIIFALSPDSVISPVCQKEVDFAESLNKRFIPIVIRDVEKNVIPDALSRLNYIFFIEKQFAGADGDFEKAVSQLVNALETDIAWIREHTRLGSLAERWGKNNQSSSLILRGTELTIAEEWLEKQPKNAPAPTGNHRAYISTSRKIANQRSKLILGLSISVTFILLGLVVIAFWQLTTQIKNEANLLLQKSKDALLLGNCSSSMRYALAALPPVNGMSTLYGSRAEADVQLAKAASLCGKAGSKKISSDNKIKKVILSPTGQCLVTFKADESFGEASVSIWNLKGSYIEKVVSLKSRSYVFFSNELEAVGLLVGQKISFRSCKTGKEVKKFVNLKTKVVGFEFDEKNNKVLGWGDNELTVWNFSSEDLIQSIKYDNGDGVRTAKFGKNAELILVNPSGGRFYGDQPITLYETSTGKKIKDLYIKQGENLFAINQTGTRAVTSSITYGCLYLWNLEKLDKHAHLCHEGSNIEDAIFIDKGENLLTITKNGKLWFWNSSAGSSWSSFEVPSEVSLPASITYYNNHIIINSRNSVHVYDAHTRKLISKMSASDNHISHVAFRHNKVIRATNDIVEWWEIPNTIRKVALLGHINTVWSAKFDPSGERVVTSSFDNTARIWDSDSGKLLQSIDINPRFVESARFNSYGDKIITLSELKRFRIWYVDSGVEDSSFILAQSQRYIDEKWVTFNKKYKLKLDYHFNGSIRILNLDGNVVYNNLGKGPLIEGINEDHPGSFSKDGILTAAPGDYPVQIYDTLTGAIMLRLGRYGTEAGTVRFSEDSRQVVSSHDNEARIWKIPAVLSYRGTKLENYVCTKLLLSEQMRLFTDDELDDPLLKKRFEIKNPCDQNGLSNFNYWLQLISRSLGW